MADIKIIIDYDGISNDKDNLKFLESYLNTHRQYEYYIITENIESVSEFFLSDDVIRTESIVVFQQPMIVKDSFLIISAYPNRIYQYKENDIDALFVDNKNFWKNTMVDIITRKVIKNIFYGNLSDVQRSALISLKMDNNSNIGDSIIESVVDSILEYSCTDT